MTRAPQPISQHEGFHYEPHERAGMRVIPPERAERYGCRLIQRVPHWQDRGGGYLRKACGARAVMEVARGYGSRKYWWAYCADHMYGTWIEDGKVWGWRLVKDEVAA